VIHKSRRLRGGKKIGRRFEGDRIPDLLRKSSGGIEDYADHKFPGRGEREQPFLSRGKVWKQKVETKWGIVVRLDGTRAFGAGMSKIS